MSAEQAARHACRSCSKPAEVEGADGAYCWQHRPATYSLLDWPTAPEGSIVWHLCPSSLHLGRVEDCAEATQDRPHLPSSSAQSEGDHE